MMRNFQFQQSKQSNIYCSNGSMEDQHFGQQGKAVTVCSDWYLSQKVLASLGVVTHT